jgi:hypothetical protein
MTKESVKSWIKTGLELNFQFENKGYYMCPIWDDNERIIGIVFCEDYQTDDVKVRDVDELWASEYRGLIVGDILDSVPEDQVDGRL